MCSDQIAFLYILANRRNGTLYIGIAHDLRERVLRHKKNRGSKLTRKHRLHTLVYYETHADIHAARRREKQMRKWNRAWKIRLIETRNPTWADLLPPCC